MSDFQINFPQALAVIDQVKSANQTITDRLQQLDGQINEALKMWESQDAKIAYDEAKKRWDQAAQQMNLILQQSYGTLDGVVERYGFSEKRTAGRWQ